MAPLRQTKIVATLGPASEDAKTVRRLVDAGVDVFRLNFSYGDHAYHGRLIEAVREASGAAGRAVAIMQDLQGPKIRVGDLEGGSVRLKRGDSLRIGHGAFAGTAARIPITYSRLARDVKAGDRILLDDGAIELRVASVRRDEVVCEVVDGGVLKSGKGMNVPGVAVRTPALTAKDRADLRFGLRAGVDFVALSFVRSPRDVASVRSVMKDAGRRVPVIAKIEKSQAIEQLDSILRAFDGAMVARGDLGVEIGPEHVPLEQKRIIERANVFGKPVITATQMLESMTASRRPTRAEVSDVANAVIDGTDAVMLSGETAAGRYPVEAVRAMDRIAREAGHVDYHVADLDPRRQTSRAHAVCHAAVDLAREVGAPAIAALSRSGRTAQILAALRPRAPIYALCTRLEIARRLTLYHGVVPFEVDRLTGEEQAIERIEQELRGRGLVPRGSDVVIVGAAPGGPAGQTNFLRLLTIG